jgi:hypothetical protein
MKKIFANMLIIGTLLLPANAASSQFDGPSPYPPVPPTSCVPFPLPCQAAL